MQDRPTAAELLATIGDYLEGEVLPNVNGTLRYHTLVAANLVKMLQRESELYPAAATTEVRLMTTSWRSAAAGATDSAAQQPRSRSAK